MKAETPPVDESVWGTNQDENGLVITGYTGDATIITIPATINGTTVVTIGVEAFFYITIAYARYLVTSFYPLAKYAGTPSALIVSLGQ
jgi:hypothetical protein